MSNIEHHIIALLGVRKLSQRQMLFMSEDGDETATCLQKKDRPLTSLAQLGRLRANMRRRGSSTKLKYSYYYIDHRTHHA